MSKTLGDAIFLLHNICGFDFCNLELDKMDNSYYISHSYNENKKTIIVPYGAITNVMSFLLNKDKRPIVICNGIKCRAYNIEEKSVFNLEKEIKEIYESSAWNFLVKWYEFFGDEMSSLMLVKMDLEKTE